MCIRDRGISLMLIQLVRLVFGAQNVEVANPAWLSGGIQVLPNLVLPYNRIVIIAFALFVVVLGGVGQLAGSVLAAFGLGIANKILEPQIGAVLGKILILALIILFIQKRPQGLFALKGRVID